MYKTTTKEVTEKFDVDGNLIERITRTETTEDDEAKESLTINPYTITPTQGGENGNSSAYPYTIKPYWSSSTTGSVTTTDVIKDGTIYTATDTTRSGIGIK